MMDNSFKKFGIALLVLVTLFSFMKVESRSQLIGMNPLTIRTRTPMVYTFLTKKLTPYYKPIL